MNAYAEQDRDSQTENKPMVTKGEKKVGLINYTSKKKRKGKKER